MIRYHLNISVITIIILTSYGIKPVESGFYELFSSLLLLFAGKVDYLEATALRFEKAFLSPSIPMANLYAGRAEIKPRDVLFLVDMSGKGEDGGKEGRNEKR